MERFYLLVLVVFFHFKTRQNKQLFRRMNYKTFMSPPYMSTQRSGHKHVMWTWWAVKNHLVLSHLTLRFWGERKHTFTLQHVCVCDNSLLVSKSAQCSPNIRVMSTTWLELNILTNRVSIRLAAVLNACDCFVLLQSTWASQYVWKSRRLQKRSWGNPWCWPASPVWGGRRSNPRRLCSGSSCQTQTTSQRKRLL